MSQSPDQPANEAPAEQLVDYRNAWSALSQLIGQGRSFSGYERNCCFLNTAGERFANVSAATRLDLIDDGRALALVDWDFDGAIDLWLANRTAPRVRLMRNTNRAGHHWVSLRLQGVTSNRDGIGARLELYSGTPSRRLIKTSRAGDGYLSQSSKWIHFGLGNDAHIERLDVLWPGGQRETFDGLEADGHFLLVQGTGRAERWTPPANRAPLVAGSPAPAAPSSSTRTWIMGRVPLPAETYYDRQGSAASLSGFRGRPLLVNLWSHTCLPCMEELTDWSRQLADSPADGPHILALCVDRRDAVANDGTAGAALEAARLALPPLVGDSPSLEVGFASDELLEALEVVQRTFLEWQQPLQVPTSVLLDPWGRVAAIYKGRVSMEQLIADRRLLDESHDAQRDAAVPFPGRWASEVFPCDPFPIVRTLDLMGRPQAPIEYLQKYVALFESEPRPYTTAGHAATLLGCYRALAERLLEQGQETEALQALAVLRDRSPDNAELHRQLAEWLLRLGRARTAVQHAELAVRSEPRDARTLTAAGLAHFSSGHAQTAIPYLRAASEQAPNDAQIHFHLANALQMTGDSVGALRHYRAALEQRPEWTFPANNLAWILATHKDPALRDGAEAVRLAELCCRAANFDDPTTLATLAAAYAETGEFNRAAATNKRAIELLTHRGRPAEARRLAERQSLFENGQPLREP